jgi:VWFA-related protein
MSFTTYSRREVLVSALASLASSALPAQETPTFSTGVKVVNVLATVRAKNGKIIRDLPKEAFSISENGRPQSIRYFSQESNLPLTLGLLIDTSVSQQRVLDAERGASFRFLDQVLRPDKDRFFIVQFDMGVWVRQELTSSLKKLDDALVQVDTPSRKELSYQSGGGTLLYDAVIKACQEITQNQQGRKALVILSDGVDTGSEATLAAAVEAAERSDTLIYSINFSDATYYSVPLLGSLGGPDGRGVLMRLAKDSGGGFFEVTKKISLDDIFTVLQEELRSQYSLGYVSDEPVHISEWRKLQLTVNEKGLKVQSRDRYWAKR